MRMLLLLLWCGGTLLEPPGLRAPVTTMPQCSNGTRRFTSINSTPLAYLRMCVVTPLLGVA